MKPSKLLRSFLLAAGSSLLAISAASAQTPLVATGTSVALSVTTSNSTNYSITGTTESTGFNGVIRNTSGNNTLSGNILLNSPSGSIRFDATGGNLIFSGNISQTGTSRALLFTPGSGSTMTVNNAMALNGGEFRTGSVVTTGLSGTVILKGVNGSGIGNTLIFQRSTLQLGVSDALNTTANLTIGSTSTNPSWADIGTFDLAAFNQTINGLNGFTSGGANAAASNRRVINSVAGTATLTVGNGGGSGTFNGQINTGTGNIQLIKTGAGNQTLSDQNSYTGGTRIDAGTLTLGHATNTLANTGAVNVNGGTLALGTNTDTVGAVTLTSGSITGSGAGTLTGTGSAYDVRSGSISAKLGGTVGLTKTTGGTVTISSDNSVGGYTGTTAVNDGTLIVNGNISTSVSTTVASGATLGGSGTVGATTISGTHSPGNSPGIMSHSSLTYENGADVIWELVANSTAGRGTNFDGINVTGALTFNGATTLGLDFDFGSSAVEWQNAFWENDYTGTNGWLVYSGATSLTGFSNLGLNSPAAWLDESGDTLASIRSGASFSLFQDGNNIYLNYTAIPEPGAALIGSLGLLALLRRRRA